MQKPDSRNRQMPESQIQTFISATYSAENAIKIKRIRDSNLLPFFPKYYKTFQERRSSDQAKKAQKVVCVSINKLF